MAKGTAPKKKKWAPYGATPAMDYGAEVKKLRQDGPASVYILRGEEDYLRDSYLEELRSLCLAEGTEAFNYHRFQGPGLDVGKLQESAEAMPFMGERTLIEVRDLDVSRTSGYDPEGLKRFLEDVPAWTTVAFVFSPGNEPDNRFAAAKALKKAGKELEFTSPGDTALVRWVIRRVESQEKTIDPDTAAYLVDVCGRRMNTLIPEITKVVGYARSGAVTRGDIDAVAKKAPETTIGDLTSALGDGKFDRAAGLLADLLADREQKPQGLIAMVSNQFRWLYVARVAMDSGKGDAFIAACIPELANWRSKLNEIKRTAEKYSAARLARAVSMCARCDYAMKDTGGEPEALMKELLLQLAMDRS